ncbi:hypothetical protein K402DRAFT_467753 [Aulographum hederae CBS 113979]|uniref:Uncharacterized protein n=1 Tax=Aulographum hederae CBS 113979 TaxID=1176131 RepID=A0A6G1GJP2_9PEZI|nr:hypothetical protein K402DRAFT_467753 [Aulographum hederae CBS 113979]
MLFSLGLLGLAASTATAHFLQERGTCNNNDNCARAVTGTQANVKPALTVRQADCSSFMVTTVTPDMVTIPVTTTLTVTSTESTSFATATTTVQAGVGAVPADEPHADGKRAITAEANEKRQVARSTPNYASSCSGPVRYSSACSCWGITASVTTLPTPSTTIITTLTETTTTTTTSLYLATETATCAVETGSLLKDTWAVQKEDGVTVGPLTIQGQPTLNVQGGPNQPWHARFFQTVTLCPGATYDLSFSYLSYSTTFRLCSVEFYSTAGSVQKTIDTSTNPDSNGGKFGHFNPVKMTVVAQEAETTISMMAYCTNGGTQGFYFSMWNMTKSA